MLKQRLLFSPSFHFSFFVLSFLFFADFSQNAFQYRESPSQRYRPLFQSSFNSGAIWRHCCGTAAAFFLRKGIPRLFSNLFFNVALQGDWSGVVAAFLRPFFCGRESSDFLDIRTKLRYNTCNICIYNLTSKIHLIKAAGGFTHSAHPHSAKHYVICFNHLSLIEEKSLCRRACFRDD